MILTGPHEVQGCPMPPVCGRGERGPVSPFTRLAAHLLGARVVALTTATQPQARAHIQPPHPTDATAMPAGFSFFA